MRTPGVVQRWILRQTLTGARIISTSDAGFRIDDAGFRIADAGFRIADASLRIDGDPGVMPREPP